MSIHYGGRGPGHIARSIGGFSPLSLFAASEPGFWYDPSDLTTLFQDSAGTTPVTAAGQSVGLVLDKSRGLTPGPEIITNGNFSDGSTGWTLQPGWTIDSGVASVNSSVAGTTIMSSTGMTVTVGKFYMVTYTVLSVNGQGVRISLGGFTEPSYRTSSGTYTLYINATTTAGFAITGGGTTTTASVDNISVKQLPGNHAIQSTSLSRPMLGRNPITGTRNLFTYSEFPNGLTDAPLRGGLLTATTFPGLSSNTGLAVGYDGTTNTYAYKTVGVNGTQYVLSVYVRMDDGNAPAFGSAIAPASTNDFAIVIGGQTPAPNSFTVENLGGGLYRVSGTAVASTSGTSGITKYSSNSSRTFKVSGYQLETGSTVTAYQKVVSAFDVTETGKADCWYLSFDGSDDFLVTPTITPGTDKAQLFAGVRKLSDTAYQAIAEMSVNPTTNAGTMALGASSLTGDPSRRTWSSVLSGSIVGNTAGAGVYAAPTTAVLAGLFDIAQTTAAAEQILRVNGADVTQTYSAADAGTGSFAANPVYIGRRDGNANPLNGQIYSLIGRFGANLPDAQISRAEAWINARTGAY